MIEFCLNALCQECKRMVKIYKCRIRKDLEDYIEKISDWNFRNSFILQMLIDSFSTQYRLDT
jgi:hypothetical protein